MIPSGDWRLETGAKCLMCFARAVGGAASWSASAGCRLQAAEDETRVSGPAGPIARRPALLALDSTFHLQIIPLAANFLPCPSVTDSLPLVRRSLPSALCHLPPACPQSTYPSTKKATDHRHGILASPRIVQIPR